MKLNKLVEDSSLWPFLLRASQVDWVSASEGDRFATVIKDMTKEIKKLGPSPLKAGGTSNG